MRKAAVEWLKSAEMDLENVAQIIDLDYLTPIAAFHSQQCVEKCFKAVLEENLQKVPKDHSTLRLFGLIKGLISIDVDTAILTDLDDLYIEARYPGEFGLLPSGKPTLEDSRGFFEVAKAVHSQVVGKLTGGTKENPEGQPLF
jgi:HEPN domain-containing protein